MKKYLDQLVLPLVMLLLTFALFFKFNKIQDEVKTTKEPMTLFSDR
jgi:hypothetical protein